MLWCLTSLVILFIILALAALTVHPLRMRLPQLGLLLRGCLALLFLLAAFGIVGLALWHLVALIRTADDERVVGSAGLLAAALLAQMLIGILTLIYGVPLWLGLAHQGGAAIVIAVATLHLYQLRRAGDRA